MLYLLRKMIDDADRTNQLTSRPWHSSCLCFMK